MSVDTPPRMDRSEGERWGRKAPSTSTAAAAAIMVSTSSEMLTLPSSLSWEIYSLPAWAAVPNEKPGAAGRGGVPMNRSTAREIAVHFVFELAFSNRQPLAYFSI